MKYLTLLSLLACIVCSYAQNFTVCNGFNGIFSYDSFVFSGVTQSDFITVTLSGTLTKTISVGNINIKLTDSDTGDIATEVQGIDICDSGAKGHNICNLPANTPLLISAQTYWSPYYPKGNYDMSVIAYGYYPNGTQQIPVACGDLTFSF